jgi:pimeloyl-ACP methyl ester carboxylesterase
MQHLLLLHGAIGSSQQLKGLAMSLETDFHIHLFDFPGHGGKDLPAVFSIDTFAESVVQYLKETKIEKISVFGYSMGGYVAMYLAKHHPELIDHVITLATKFEWNESIAAKEIKMLQPDIIEKKLPAFAETLQKRHSPVDWKLVLNLTSKMLQHLGSKNTLALEDYATINTPVLVMIGDRDKMVSLDETVAVYRQLPLAQLAVLPATPHPVEQVDVDFLAYHFKKFIMKY